MALTDELERVIFAQEQMAELSSIMILLIVFIIVIGLFVGMRTAYVMDRSNRRQSHRTINELESMKQNLREVSRGLNISGMTRYGRHKAISEITDKYYSEQSKDLHRIEEIKLQLSASSLFDGTKSQKLVKELKILEDRRKFHGINIVIKHREEDDYRIPEKVVKGNDDDNSLIKMK